MKIIKNIMKLSGVDTEEAGSFHPPESTGSTMFPCRLCNQHRHTRLSVSTRLQGLSA